MRRLSESQSAQESPPVSSSSGTRWAALSSAPMAPEIAASKRLRLEKAVFRTSVISATASCRSSTETAAPCSSVTIPSIWDWIRFETSATVEPIPAAYECSLGSPTQVVKTMPFVRSARSFHGRRVLAVPLLRAAEVALDRPDGRLRVVGLQGVHDGGVLPGDRRPPLGRSVGGAQPEDAPQ